MAGNSPNVATGTVTGTGSAISISTGFRPKEIRIYNRTQKATGIWNDAMADASALLTIDSGVGTTDLSFVTSAGLTPSPLGFTIGTNAALNTASDVIYYTAIK